MGHRKFDMSKLERLNDPGRFETLPPDVFWTQIGHPDGAAAIVEIGAGTGVFAVEFARRAPGAVVYAVDTADAMLEWMRDNRPEVAAGRIVPVKSSETEVPLEDGLADVVYMINLHHELADPELLYAEAYRLLRSGGVLLVVDWADRETPRGPSREVRVSADALAGVLETAGFDAVRADDTTLPWHVMATARR